MGAGVGGGQATSSTPGRRFDAEAEEFELHEPFAEVADLPGV